MRIVAAAAVLGVLACAAEPVTLTRLRETPTAYTLNSGFTSPARLVVRDAGHWRDVWARIGASGSPPAVDFAASMVLVAAIGTQRSGGFDVRIEALEVNGGDGLVTVVEQTPAADCSVLAALTSPADVVVVPRSEAVIAFRTVRTQARC